MNTNINIDKKELMRAAMGTIAKEAGIGGLLGLGALGVGGLGLAQLLRGLAAKKNADTSWYSAAPSYVAPSQEAQDLEFQNEMRDIELSRLNEKLFNERFRSKTR
jgi:hypothetical protein